MRDTFIMERYEEELGKNIEIDAPELEEGVSLVGRAMTWQAHPNTSRKARCRNLPLLPSCSRVPAPKEEHAFN